MLSWSGATTVDLSVANRGRVLQACWSSSPTGQALDGLPKAEMIAIEPSLPSLTRLPLASEERLAAALAQIGRLSAELRLHGALYEIKQMLRRCDEIEHLLYLATP
jgi:hypothetical protein